MDHIPLKAIHLYTLSALDALDRANVPQAQVELQQVLKLCTSEGCSIPPYTNHPNLGKVLLSPDEIYHRVQVLGQDISKDHPNGVHLIGILHASKKFVTDLARHITPSCSVEFLEAAHFPVYTSPVEALIFCDTIRDSGKTLQERCVAYPFSKTCVLMDKEPTEKKAPLDYVGFICAERHYPVGYGLDHDQAFRNLSYIVEYLNPTKLRSREE